MNIYLFVEKRVHAKQSRVTIECKLTIFFYVEPTSPRHVNVSALDSTSLNVTWKPPEEKNGKILHYVIYYERVGSGKQFSIVTAASELQKVIKNLKPYTNYAVQVVANTSAGYGSKSDEKFERTGQTGALKLIILLLIMSL